MARFLDVHPDNPQPRLLEQVVAALRDDDALIAYPTDSGYALGCRIGNRDGRDRILRIRGLDERHHFTLMCRDFSQMGQLVHVDNAAFRTIKSATPGPYTFILPATPEVPRRLLHPRKRTVGVRIPDHVFDQALLEALGEAMLTSSLILPGEDEPRTMGWEIKEELDNQVDIVVEAGETPGRADHGHRLVRGRARGAARGRGRPGAVRGLARRGSGGRSRHALTGQQRHQAQGVAARSGPRCGAPGPTPRPARGRRAAARWPPGDRAARTANAPSMISGGSTPTVKKSRGRTSRARPRQMQHEPQVEEHADPADQGDVDHDDAQGDGNAERDDGATRLAALVPDRPGVAHRATLGGSSSFCRERRAGPARPPDGPRAGRRR